MIAGLVRPDRGRVVVDGVTLLDTENGVIVPVHRRRIGYVFQDARLMPHFSVRQNLLFGRWFARDRTGGPSLEAVADLLGLFPLLGRRPAGLSGGERQRVAIGRALLARPRLLLMDEPLSALDEARKAEILPYVARLRDEARVPIVYVSHALAEVARLADTVAVLDQGRSRPAVPPPRSCAGAPSSRAATSARPAPSCTCGSSPMTTPSASPASTARPAA